MFERGEKVQSITDPSRIGVVTGVRPPHAGVAYLEVTWLHTGATRVVGEQDLRPYTAGATPMDNLKSGRLAGYREFQRLVTRQRLSREHPLHNNISAYNASRTRFYPYQFKPLLKFIDSHSGRLLIADEVGLGKTIEAGLILTELLAREEVRRVLVVCPSSLSRKWQMEMRDRFELRFDILSTADITYLVEDFERHQDLSRFFGIVSLETVRQESIRQRLADAEIDFDLVIVDEAHHLRNLETMQRKAGVVLSDAATAMLMLTATPVHLGNENLFSLLNVLDADAFSDMASTDEQIRNNEPIVTAQRLIGAARPDFQAILDVLAADKVAHSISGNPLYDDLLRRLDDLRRIGPDAGDAWQRGRVEAQRDLADLNLIGHIFTRTRKRDVQTMVPARRPVSYRLKFTKLEEQFYDAVTDFVRAESERRGRTPLPVQWVLNSYQRRMASSIPAMVDYFRHRLLSEEEDDVVPDDVASTDLESAGAELEGSLTAIVRSWSGATPDTKYNAFAAALAELGNEEPQGKVMVFAFYKATLDYLEKHLGADGFDVYKISGDVPASERPDVIEQFRENARFGVLLSSRVGSEGLDFQFCSTMFNYDVPWNPMELEQRIGRLDRIGQDAKVIRICNLWIEGTIEDRIFRKLYDRIGIFRQSIGDLEPILGDVISTLEKGILSRHLTLEEEQQQVRDTLRAVEEKKQQLERLEKDSAKLVGTDYYLNDELDKINTHRRYVTPEQLHRFLHDFMRIHCPRSRIGYHQDTKLGRIWLDGEMRMLVADYCTATGTPLPPMPLEADIPVTFDSSTAYNNPRLVFINVLHPFVGAALRHSEKSCGEVNAQQVRLCTESLTPGLYFYFVYRLDIHAARGRSSLQMLLFDDRMREVGDSDTCEQLLGEMVEKGEEPAGPRLEVIPERMAAIVEGARVRFHERMDDLRNEYSRTNNVFIEKRLASYRLSYERKIAKQKELLERGESKGSEERYLRMRRGTMDRLQLELDSKVRTLEQQRHVQVDYEEVCAGIVEVVA